MRISIVGGGVMGLAAAWALARDGHTVTVFEQGDVPNPLGSSVDQHRLIRHPYGGERGYTRMINAAYAAWNLLWADLGTTHYAATGTLVLGHGDAWTAACEQTLAVENIPFRRLDPRQLARDAELLDTTAITTALLLDSGGVLFAERIVADLARHLRQRGVAIETHARVQHVDGESGRLTLDGGRTIAAERIIVAAGPWVTRLVPALRPRVTPSRQAVVYLTPPADLAAAWAQSPMVLDIDPATGFYLVPPRDGAGLKIGDHRFSLTGDPDRDRVAGDTDIAPILTLCAARLRDFERYTVAEAKTCFYDVAAHEHFIVEQLGARGVVLSGFSGHGFKFAAVLGHELARTLRGERPIRDLSEWAAGQLPKTAPDVVQGGP